MHKPGGDSVDDKQGGESVAPQAYDTSCPRPFPPSAFHQKTQEMKGRKDQNGEKDIKIKNNLQG